MLEQETLKEGQKYSRKEIMSILGVSENQMGKHTQAVLDFLSSFCSFRKLKEGRQVYFEILEIFGPVEKYTPKKARDIIARKKYTAELIPTIIEEDKYYSGALIARIAECRDEKFKNFPVKLDTKTKDVREYMTYNYGTVISPPLGLEDGDFIGHVSEFGWCIIRKPNKNNDIQEEYYERMTPEQETCWKQIRKEAKQQIEEEDDILFTLEGLSHTDPAIKEKYDKAKAAQDQESYKLAVHMFYDKFGGPPAMGSKYKKEPPTEEVFSRYESFSNYLEKKKNNELLKAEPGAFDF